MFVKKKPEELLLKPHDIWLNKWFLLTAGDFQSKNYNTMTVAWGSIGTMWNKPFAMAVVRPTRYTYEFTEKFDNFTLCAFPEKYKPDLKILGTKSGKDIDKINYEGIKAIASEVVSSPSYLEADLIIECKKIYFDDFKPENFLDPKIEKSYPLKDYHRIYFGEIVNILERNNQ
ncbi:MAG: flavin reductase [Melioribacteraceae bacterium]|nr:MAG: flavin reductase [Melioribacteraceae bacterium]